MKNNETKMIELNKCVEQLTKGLYTDIRDLSAFLNDASRELAYAYVINNECDNAYVPTSETTKTLMLLAENIQNSLGSCLRQ